MKHAPLTNSIKRLLLPVLLISTSIESSHATTRTWSDLGADNTWSTTSSAKDWSANTAPLSTDTADFNAGGNTNPITIGSGASAPTISLIQFGATAANTAASTAIAYTLGTAANAGTINFTPGTADTNNLFLTYYGTGNTANETINSSLSLGTTTDTTGWQITSEAAGTLTIAGNVTRVSTQSGTGVKGGLVIAGTKSGSGNVTLTGSISGFTSILDQLGAGSTLTIAGNNGTNGALNLGNLYNGSYGNILLETNNFSSATAGINIFAGASGAGTLQLEGGLNLSAHPINIADARFSVAGGGGNAHIENVSGNNSIGTVTLNNPNSLNSGTYINIKLDADTLTIGALATNVTAPTANNLGTSDTQTFFFYGGANAIVKGAIDDTGNTPIAIEENNQGGSLTLQSAGTYVGGTTLDAGTLVAANTAAFGVAGSAVTLNGGTLDLATDTSVNAYNTTVTATTTILADRATAGNGITQTLGTLAIGAETLNVQAGSNVTGGSPAVVFGAVTLTDNGTTILKPTTASLTVGSVTGSAGSGTSTLDLDGTSAGNAVTGPISDLPGGKIAVSKTNSSVWTLSGANTYTGGTSVTGGTLNVTGSLDSGSAVTVSNAKLEGTGSVGAVNVGANGILAPGATASGGTGTLSTGSVSFVGSATLSFVLDSDNTSASDLLAVNGNLTLNSATLSLADEGSTNLTFGTLIDLANYSGTLSGTFAGLTDGSQIQIGANTYTIDYGTGSDSEITLSDISGSVAAVPEPSTWALLLLPLSVIAFVRHRKTQSGV